MGSGPSDAVAQSTQEDGDFDYKKHLFLQTKDQVHREDCKEDNSSEILRHPDAKDGVWNKGCVIGDVNADNIYDIWAYAVKEHADRKCLGWRKLDDEGNLANEYTYETYTETNKVVEALASAMAASKVEKGTNIGIFSRNRPEWTTTMLASQCLSARTVALYDTLGDEALQHILKQAEIHVLFTEKNKLKKLKQILSAEDTTHNVTTVVIFDYQEKFGNKIDEITDEDKEQFKGLNVTLTGMSDYLTSGVEAFEKVLQKPGPEDLCNIMYTSGTTGLPKGVMLQHMGLACAVQAAVHRLTNNDIVAAGGRHYSYLPLAHIFELMVEIVAFRVGLSISFSNGNIKKLAEDLDLVKPTIFIGVPRIYSKFYEKFKAGVEASTGIKKSMATNAFRKSSVYIRDNQRSWIYDKTVWAGVAKKMGLNKCKLTITGAAPMPGYLMEFMKLVTNCPMIQGYGLTETMANGGISLMTDTTVGHIGIPTIANEMRVVDVPDMKYLHTDTQEVATKDGEKRVLNMPRGEIQIRGPPVFMGYYKMPEKTKEVMTEDGWFCTGDIGRINPNGTMSIIDRKKNIFKLSQGEYIAVEKVENQYGKSAAINQVWAYGNSHKSFLVAVVTPNATWVQQKFGDRWENKDTPATDPYNAYFKEICEKNLEEVHGWVMEDMKLNTGKLKGFEKIRQIHLELTLDNLLQGFNVDNNCMTPSFKLKRPQLLARYSDQLKALYTKGGEPPKDGEKW